MQHATEIGSWVGMVLLLAAFAGRRRLPDRLYSAMNFVGALLVGIKCWETKTYAAAGLEAVWMIVAAWFFFKPQGKLCGECQSRLCPACRTIFVPPVATPASGGVGG